MNFRTTTILMVILAAGVVFLAIDKFKAKPAEEVIVDPEGRKIVDIKRDLVTKVTLQPANGKPIVLEKDNLKWKLTSPLAVWADTMMAGQLIDAVLDLHSRGSLDVSSENLKSTGLDKPRYVIEVATKDGTPKKLEVGNSATIGSGLYVREDGKKKIVQVTGGKLGPKLDQTAEVLVSTLRDKQLITLANPDWKQLEITGRAGQNFVFRKINNQWQMVQPQAMPADEMELTDLISTVTGLRADTFIDEGSREVSAAQFSNPAVTVWMSTDPPSATTMPASAPASGPAFHIGGTTVVFGQYTDVLKEKMYVKLGSTMATVPMQAAYWDKLNKTRALDYRDRRALDIDPTQVSNMSIVSHLLATTQPVRPAGDREISFERKKVTLNLPGNEPPIGVAAPGVAATNPATAPTSGPALPPSKWTLKTGGTGDADESRINTLLESLHPMRVIKYLDPTAPATQPTANYVIKFHTEAAGGGGSADYEISLIDPGAEKSLEGSYGGLRFELDRDLVRKLEGDWMNKLAPPRRHDLIRVVFRADRVVCRQGSASRVVSNSMAKKLSHLGHKSILSAKQIVNSRTILETFDNPRPKRDYTIEFVFPEFTSVCPVTGQPDFATITVTYIPDRLCVEMKSLKLYYFSYRNKGIFYEEVINTILDDLTATLKPRWMKVVGQFAVRGGTGATITAEFGANPSGRKSK